MSVQAVGREQFLVGAGLDDPTVLDAEDAVGVEVGPGGVGDPPAVPRCEDCGGQIGSTIAHQLLDHPAIVAFLDAHDVPIEERPFWGFEFCIGDENAELVSKEPFRVVVSLECESDELRLTVDESADVVEYALIERG